MTTPTQFNYAQVDGVCLAFPASAALTSRHFVRIDDNGEVALAPVGDASASGVLLNTSTARYQEIPVVTHGKAEIIADTALAVRDFVKAGSQSRATRGLVSAHTVHASAAGTGNSFTTRAASVITIAQAADVAADRGRGIVLVGTDAASDPIIETVNLDATNSTTGVASTLTFLTLTGIYTENGANLGAQNVTATAVAGLRATLAGGTSTLGAIIPTANQEAYSGAIILTSAAADATFATIVGYAAAAPDTLIAEEVQFDAATPSLATTTATFRRVERICTGEHTNANTFSVTVAADAPGVVRGRVVTAAAARGDTAVVQLY